MAQCKARAKSTGERCRRRAVTGYTVCQVHGAGSPFKGRPGMVHKRPAGKYSKLLPTRLLALYEEAQSDTELLSLRHDIALLEARVMDMLKRVDTGESGDLWKRTGEVVTVLKNAFQDGDDGAVASAIADLEDLVSHGIEDWGTWREIGAVLERKRKLTDTERKRLVDMQQMITAERALALITAFTQVVKRHVTDTTTLLAISAELGTLLSQEDPGTAAAGSQST